jgi:hypothetical protein
MTTMATNAIETLTDLIDANKDKMADYDYMKMMDCLKELFEKKNVNHSQSHTQKELYLTNRNNQLTKRFFALYTAKTRCSTCGDINHTKQTCKYSAEIIKINKDGTQYDVCVYIGKNCDEYNNKYIYEISSRSFIGFASTTRLPEIEQSSYTNMVNGEFHYYQKSAVDYLLLTDTATSVSTRQGLTISRVNGKSKYFTTIV